MIRNVIGPQHRVPKAIDRIVRLNLIEDRGVYGVHVSILKWLSGLYVEYQIVFVFLFVCFCFIGS